MIASLRGTVIDRGIDWVVVESGGVGYHLSVSSHALEAIPPIDSEAGLLCEMLVREDSIALYGFSDSVERDLFRLLITVNGVGPRVAIATLSVARPAEIVAAVGAGDTASFTRVPGIGKRTAERIIVELDGKLDALPVAVAPASGGRHTGNEAIALARDGLAGLGYDPAEIDRMLTGVKGDSPEELIATALRSTAGGDEGR